MINPVVLTFTHSNLLEPVSFYAETIMGVTWLKQNQTTALIGVGGSVIPVQGKPEDVEAQVTKAKSEFFAAVFAATNNKTKSKKEKETK